MAVSWQANPLIAAPAKPSAGAVSDPGWIIDFAARDELI
jgi:hypothetical protein